jgi:hypothetical protein
MVDSKLPKWAEPLLQGLSYWLGYKKQLYRHYPLSEGAIIGEALHLIYSNIGEGEKLECEVMYKMLNKNINHMGNAREDIVIKNPNDIPIHVIETKRSIAPNAAIIDDFKKLANAKSKFPNCHFYLLLVAQGRRPSNYVNEDGVAIKGFIHGVNYKLKVRRVCKASDTFKKIDNANYACLIEVQNI